MSHIFTKHELKEIGLACFGSDVIIKKTVRFYNPTGIYIGNNVIIDDFTILSAKAKIILGNNIHISPFCGLYGRYGIEMEDYSGLASRVALYSESDDYTGYSLTNDTIPEKFKPNYGTGPIRLLKHSIIGTNSTVLPNVTVGEGAAVGGHTLVTKDLLPWSVYFGCPAKKIKKRKNTLLDDAIAFEKHLLNQK